VQRLVLGGHLRRLREESGMTTEAAAAVSIRGSHSKISRNGAWSRRVQGARHRRPADPVRGRPGCRAPRPLLNLARGSQHARLVAGTRTSCRTGSSRTSGLEGCASFIREYELAVRPAPAADRGLRRAVIRPAPDVGRRVERRTRARISRQEILHRENPPKVWAVLDEGALGRVIGGPQVMRHS